MEVITLDVSKIKIKIPGTCECIYPGCKIKLNRFSNILWTVNCGWFNFDDNRPFWGMYLTNLQTGNVKPLLQTDLEDIYIIE